MTNKEYARTDKDFQQACEKVGLPFDKIGKGKGKHELTRQASKWRRWEGLAWGEGRS